jgi:hypothetical protein
VADAKKVAAKKATAKRDATASQAAGSGAAATTPSGSDTSAGGASTVEDGNSAAPQDKRYVLRNLFLRGLVFNKYIS